MFLGHILQAEEMQNLIHPLRHLFGRQLLRLETEGYFLADAILHELVFRVLEHIARFT